MDYRARHVEIANEAEAIETMLISDELFRFVFQVRTVRLSQVVVADEFIDVEVCHMVFIFMDIFPDNNYQLSRFVASKSVEGKSLPVVLFIDFATMSRCKCVRLMVLMCLTKVVGLGQAKALRQTCGQCS